MFAFYVNSHDCGKNKFINNDVQDRDVKIRLTGQYLVQQLSGFLVFDEKLSCLTRFLFPIVTAVYYA